jgi:hypothetical protein
MNSKGGDMSFIRETEEDYEDMKIHTLDYKLWVNRTTNTLQYQFFTKPMATPDVTLESSVWAWNPKSASLAQEVVRRVGNTSEDLPLAVTISTIDQFTTKISHSGYSRSQVSKGVETKKERTTKEG